MRSKWRSRVVAERSMSLSISRLSKRALGRHPRPEHGAGFFCWAGTLARSRAAWIMDGVSDTL